MEFADKYGYNCNNEAADDEDEDDDDRGDAAAPPTVAPSLYLCHLVLPPR
jgi:hypothetical protein